MFAKTLLTWYGVHGRKLPWRETTDPYAILVSEIMLQQTQVDRVVPKYLTWLDAFPTWDALASGKRADVLRLWSGLGYNSRAARLHTLAKVITETGAFPKDEKALKKLPGIGPYTAGAVRAFAYNLPGQFIDVNVERVLKRVMYTRRQRPTRKSVEDDLLSLQQSYSPRLLGNALMDLGSLFCVAANPKCDMCPVAEQCKSRGERPEESAYRTKKRQPTFLYSNRWWRGQIVKQLTQQALTAEQLFTNIHVVGKKKDFESALVQLKKEKFVAGKKKLSLE